MTTLTIKDLSITKDLDEKAMIAVRGGQGSVPGSGAAMMPGMGWGISDLPMTFDAMMGAYLGGNSGGTTVSTSISSTPSETGENHGYSTNTVTKEY